MEISGNKPPDEYLISPNTQKVNGTNEDVAGKNGVDAGTASDRISLSGKAKEVEELKKVVSEVPDVRQDKVEAIKTSILEGTYKVDSLKVASKLLE